MEIYSLDTKFTFGIYEGKTVEEVIKTNPAYIDWCIINEQEFYITGEVIEAIVTMLPDFALSEEGMVVLASKNEMLEIEDLETNYLEVDCEDSDEDTEDYEEYWDDDELELADWDYDPMNPAHDRNENPWIDVFGPGEEAETAYWNTD